MKEIGGYFGLDKFRGDAYYEDLLALNTGRNALLYVVITKNIRRLWIPYYLCDSVSDVLFRNEIDFSFYHVDKDFRPVFDQDLGADEFLYLVNYYGQLTNDDILEMKGKYQHIIVDNVQSFFQKPIDGIDTLYSCRKYFGVPDGAYLSTDEPLKKDLQRDISKDRMIHILGRFEGNASDYYECFKANDLDLKHKPLMQMSQLTKNLLRGIDYASVKKMREDNYLSLKTRIGKSNRLRISHPSGPFAYPFYVENGLEVRKKLAKKGLYIPILWPNTLTSLSNDSIEHDYVANILPLPCDQRYGLEDMEKIVGILKSMEVCG